MAAAEFEDILLGAGPDDVDNPAVVLLLTETLQDEVVADGFLVLHKVVRPAARLEHQRVGVLADLALEALPEEGLEIGAGLCLTLDLEPAAETLKVDEAHRARALARAEQWVLLASARSPAEAAFLLIGLDVGIGIHDGGNLLEFLELVVAGGSVNGVGAVTPLACVGLVDLHFLAVCCVPDFLDSELDPAYFENVPLLDFVILI